MLTPPRWAIQIEIFSCLGAERRVWGSVWKREKRGHTVIDDVVMVCWKAEVNYSAPSQQLVRRPA